MEVRASVSAFIFLALAVGLGDGLEMDFLLGSAQMQSLTVSPGQHELLALQSVAFHGIIEFRKGCRYTTGVLLHSGNNSKFLRRNQVKI